MGRITTTTEATARPQQSPRGQQAVAAGVVGLVLAVYAVIGYGVYTALAALF